MVAAAAVGANLVFALGGRRPDEGEHAVRPYDAAGWGNRDCKLQIENCKLQIANWARVRQSCDSGANSGESAAGRPPQAEGDFVAKYLGEMIYVKPSAERLDAARHATNGGVPHGRAPGREAQGRADKRVRPTIEWEPMRIMRRFGEIHWGTGRRGDAGTRGRSAEGRVPKAEWRRGRVGMPNGKCRVPNLRTADGE